ncbi:MAG: CpaD family pilus assembly protein [Pseudomonadota bacterium]
MSKFLSSTGGANGQREANSTRRGPYFASRVVFASATCLALAACNTASHYGGFDPRALNYDQRHALSLQQQEHTLPLLIGEGARGLTPGDRTALDGFVRSYSSQGSGSLEVRVPSGSANAAAATHALAEIHDIVAGAGGHPSRIAVHHYQVQSGHAHAPVYVAYNRLEAVTSECGRWPDGVNQPGSQSDYFNFGCATQSNFGAMLDDPRDLIRPRGVGRPDAGRRAEVLARYRRGEPTGSEPNDPEGASVADVN